MFYLPLSCRLIRRQPVFFQAISQEFTKALLRITMLCRFPIASTLSQSTIPVGGGEGGEGNSINYTVVMFNFYYLSMCQSC